MNWFSGKVKVCVLASLLMSSTPSSVTSTMCSRGWYLCRDCRTIIYFNTHTQTQCLCRVHGRRLQLEHKGVKATQKTYEMTGCLYTHQTPNAQDASELQHAELFFSLKCFNINMSAKCIFCNNNKKSYK